MDGFTPPYRMDRNTVGGGIALYLREDIPSRQISLKNGEIFCWNQHSQEEMANFMFI